MPLYEFQCPQCGARFEEIVSLSKVDEVVCEKCGWRKPERLMSTFATGRGSSASSAQPCSTGPSGFS